MIKRCHFQFTQMSSTICPTGKALHAILNCNFKSYTLFNPESGFCAIAMRKTYFRPFLEIILMECL